MTLTLSSRKPTTPAFRPLVALAMQDAELRDALFSERLRTRLHLVANCDFDLVINDFSGVPDEFLSRVDVLITGWFSPKIDRAVLERMPQLRLIAHAGGSVKGHVDPECWHRGIHVTTAALANAIPVAEFALGQILLAGKSVLAGSHLYRTRQGKIDREREFPCAGNYEKTVGIVGASTIGRLVIDKLRSFDYTIAVYDPTLTDAEVADLGGCKVGLEELMRRSDIVSLHAPVLPATKRMIGRRELEAMRPGATLINTARGALIDHEALRQVLADGRITAFLDVTDPEPLPAGDPLYNLPNVMLTPHLAGSMGTELYRLAEYAIHEVERLSAGAEPRYPVRISDLASMA